ncbi:MAG: putative lipoprotein [Ramlibacter sp.]|nr:putative lipoprotein [Ramlibacter sp.]
MTPRNLFGRPSCAQGALAAVALLAAASASAQGIERRSEAYRPSTVLPIAAPNAAAVASTIAATAASGPARTPPAPPGPFSIGPADHSIREALSRWAKAAGWTHEAAHWTLDRDFPVEGSAGAEVFGLDFKTAVRTLLGSTELTERPVQPCFYSNRVVRVIPQAEICDRTAE